MLYRNFLAMETEEMLRSNPIDGAILLGGCDKIHAGAADGRVHDEHPGHLHAGGPMMKGNWHGEVLGSGSDVWKYWDEKRAGNLSGESWCEIEDGIARSPGHCMTMGTASTMTALAEVLGFAFRARRRFRRSIRRTRGSRRRRDGRSSRTCGSI